MTPSKSNRRCRHCGVALRIGRNWLRSSAECQHYECNPCKNARNSLHHKGLAWRIKLEVMSHYCGGPPKCEMCPETDLRVLCMDHVNSDGASLRKAGQPTGYGLYRLLRKQGYPPGYQVLCENDNRRMQHERGEFRKSDDR